MQITNKPSGPLPGSAGHAAATAELPARYPDLHGACIIDAQGREIPITEHMIRHACQELIQAWEQARLRHT